MNEQIHWDHSVKYTGKQKGLKMRTPRGQIIIQILVKSEYNKNNNKEINRKQKLNHITRIRIQVIT